MPIRDIFNKLSTTVLGTKTANIDAKLDSAVKDIVSYKSQTGQGGYVELIKNLISQSGSMRMDNQGLFNQGPTSPATFGQGGRLMRYKTYEAIVNNINYCFRALNVLTDNILAPDDITKVSLEITPQSFLEAEVDTDSRSRLVREIIERLKLEENLDLVVKNTLLFGDFFVEIVDAKEALTSRAYLAEDYVQYVNGTRELVHSGKLEGKEGKEIKVFMDYSAHQEAKQSKKDKKEKKKEKKKDEKVLEPEKDVSEIQIVYHEPKRVVKLQSDLFPMCFGYLIFPRYSVSPQLAFQDQSINSICTSILQSLEKNIPQTKEMQKSKDLKDIITALLKETDYTHEMDVRFVPPDRMQHFQVPSTKYYPYGESIFDTCQFNAKVLIALETALAIQRLARSTEKRKVAIEIGLPRDARKLIEKLKEEFRKRKVSLDSFGTVDTIPSMVTTFEDIYIPQKDGKPFVDVNTFTEGNVDVRGKVDELKFIRDSLVASLGVPASFLNIEENLSNKAALSEENILFARTIIAHQKYLTNQVVKLIHKIYQILDPENALTLLDNVAIAFPPPKSLQFEREARYLGELANLVETLERIGIPKEWAKRKYLTSIDWDDLKKYEIDEKIEKNLGTEEEDEAGGMGDMGGMGGAGGGGMGF